jgi:urea transport system permease protein
MNRLCRGVFALLLLLLPIGAVHAAELPEVVQQLGSDSFDAKADAVTALGSLGDPRAVKILNALRDGRLFTTTDDNKVVIADPNGDNFDISDPVTGDKIDTVADDKIDRILVNNRLRNGIDAALAGLNLFSERREDRLSAAADAMKHPAPERIPALEKSLAAEKDAEVHAAIALALASADLRSADKKRQLAAIAALADASNPDIFNVLSEAREAPGLDPDIKRALDTALGAISKRIAIFRAAATVFEGLSLGSILLLAAIGLAITFGVMGVINMAHGEMIMLGAYATFVVQELFRTFLPPGWFDAYLVVAVPVGFLVAGAVGVLLERTVIRFLYGRPLETLLATWGVSLVLQQGVRTLFGAPNKAVANPAWMTGGIDLAGGVTLTWNRLVILIFCFVVLGALSLLLKRTSFGLHMRAVTQNRDMAAVMGIPTARIDALTFGLGSGIAGIAGVALSQIGNVSPNLGSIYIVDSFMVVVFGGVGSLLGTLAGAMSLGIINKVLEPVAGAVLGKIVVLVFIILFIQKRPRGLFALKGRAAEG